jgi:hypothetical protein
VNADNTKDPRPVCPDFVDDCCEEGLRAAICHLKKLGWTPDEITGALEYNATEGDALPQRLFDAYERTEPAATRDFESAVARGSADSAAAAFVALYARAAIDTATAYHKAERRDQTEYPTTQV